MIKIKINNKKISMIINNLMKNIIINKKNINMNININTSMVQTLKSMMIIRIKMYKHKKMIILKNSMKKIKRKIKIIVH